MGIPTSNSAYTNSYTNMSWKLRSRSYKTLNSSNENNVNISS